MVMLDPSKPGVPPGKYRVIVYECPLPKNPILPEKYAKEQSTPWEVTVPANGKRDIRLTFDE